MSGNNVVKRFGDGPTINTPPIPRLVNPRSESLFRLPATDEINVINAGIHEVYPTKQIVRKIRQENRLNYQMNPPAYKQEDDGAQFVNYAGGYFRAWYIDMGVVTYLPGMYDTESSAKEAARNAKATRTHNGGPAFQGKDQTCNQ